MRRQLGFLPATLAALAALSGCKPPDAALKVTVTLKSQGTTRVRADCIKLAVLQDTVEKKSITVKRPADDSLVFAVLRGEDLPKNVNLQVTGFLGKCDDESTLQLNAQGSLEPATFPESGVLPFELSLDPPGVALDADRDGFVSSVKGGPDCRDDDATIFPGATQVCSSQVDTDCDSKLGCDDSECTSATFCLDEADRVVVTPTAPTMNRGDCLKVRIELANASGPRTAVRDTPLTFASSISGVTVHNTSDCGQMALTSLPILFNSTFAEVWLKADETAFGSNTFSVTASRIATPGTAVVEVHPRLATGIRFTNQPLTLNAGTCGAMPVTLEFFDSGNLPTAVDAPTSINLSVTPEEVVATDQMIYGDANCMTATRMVMLQPGQGTATVYLSVKQAGPHIIRAASIGAPATQNFNVLPSTPHHLKFTNGTLALLTTNFCSTAQLVVELQDTFNNPSSLNVPLPLTMSVMGAAPVRFFQTNDTGCTVPLTDFTLPPNATSVNIQAGSMGTGSGTRITVAANITVPPIMPDTQDIIISSGPASAFTWAGQPQTTLAGACSSSPLTIELRDTTGNLASGSSSVNFNLNTAPGADSSFHFYSGAGCLTDLNGVVTVPPGQTSTQIFFRGNRVMSDFTIGATSTLNPPATMLQHNNILPNVPAKLSFGMPLAQTSQAGSCTAAQYVVNVLDTFDNPTVFTSAQTVTVASNPAGVTVGTAPACTGSSLPLPTMTGSASFSAKHTVTSPVTPYQLTASVSGFSTSTPATLNVTPGMPSLLVDVPAAGATSLVAGVCQNVTLSRRDMFNNNAPTSGANNLAITFPNGTQWDLYTQQNCMGTAGGTVTMTNTHTTSFSLRPKTAGMHMVQVSVAGTAAVVNFNVAPGTPTLVFETPNTLLGTAAASQTAGGCTAVTVARKDTFGNDVPLGSMQNLTFTLPTGTTIFPDPNCMMATITSVAMGANEVRATFYVRATVSAPTGGPAPQNVSAILSGQTATLTLTVSPATAMANLVTPASMVSVTANLACVMVTVERRDAFNNLVPVPGGTTSMTVTGPTAMSVFDSSNCTGMAITQSPAGTSTVAVTAGSSSKTFSVRNTTASMATVTPTLAGLTYPFTLTVTPGPLTVYLLEGLSSPITAGACSAAMQVRRRDNFGNDIVNDPPQTVTLNSAVFSFSTTPTTCMSAMAGPFNVNIPTGSPVSTVPFYVTGTNAIATSISATGGTGTGTLNVTVSPASPASINFVTAAVSGTAGTCLAGSFSIDLRDMYNNQVRPSSAYAVTLGSAPTGTFGAGGSCAGGAVSITSAAPVATFSFLPVTSGTNVITASGAGPLSNTTNVNVSPGMANTLAWRTNPTAAPARFTCVPAGVIESRDGNGNLSAVNSALTVNLNSTVPSVTFFPDAACAMPPITSTTIPMGSDATPAVFMFTTGTAADLTGTATSFTATPVRTITPSGANGVLVVTPANPDLEAGACIAMTVQRQDNTPATLSTGNTALTISVPSNQGVSLYTTTDCTGSASNSLNRTIANGASTTIVYARGRSAVTGGTPNNVTLTASALGSTDGTATLKVYPLVRRGTCNVTATNSTSRCAVSPAIPMKDLSRSFLVFSSSGRPATTSPNAMAASDQNVSCALDSTNANVEVVCTRGGVAGDMTVQYQVVSFGRDAASGFGISVQHAANVATSTSSATTTQTITNAVDTSKSFILASSNYTDTLNNGEGFPIVKFTTTGASVNSLDIVSNTAAPTTRSVSFQVVTLGFATTNVIHSTVSLPTVGTGNNYVITTASTTAANTFALAMAAVMDGTNPETMCRRRFNTKVASNTTITLHRATGTQPATCTDGQSTVNSITTQRVFWPNAAAASFDVTFNNNTTASQNTAQFTAVAKDKSICFLQTQGPGGQASGEANFTGTGADGDDTGPFHASLDFNGAGDRVVVTREASVNTTSTFSPVVVQFDP